MTALEHMNRLFAGESPGRLLVQPICMTFAARLKERDYYSYVTDYRVLVESQLAVAEAFDLDILTLCSDPCREAADCGAAIRWFPDQPPTPEHANALLSETWRLRRLKQPDPLGGGRMHDRVKGVESLRKEVGGDLPILGWVEGPMAESADLRGMNAVMYDLVDNPAFVRDLFEFILEMEIRFAKAQIEAGADVIGIGDAAASLVNARLYRECVLPYERRLIDAIHAEGCPVRLHICGNVTHLLEDIATLPIEMIDIDCLTDLEKAAKTIPSNVAILGNIDPVRWVLRGSVEEMETVTAECHRIVGERYIVGPGCEVPPLSPHENVRVMTEYADSHAPSMGQ